MEFRVVKERYVTKTLRLEKRLNDQLVAISREYGISLNSLIVQCIRFALDNYNKEKTQSLRKKID